MRVSETAWVFRAILISVAVVLGSLALSACTTPAQDALVVCRAYDATLRTLAGYRAADKLSAEDIATVDRLRPIMNEGCSGPPDAATLDAIERGLFELIAIEEGAQ